MFGKCPPFFYGRDSIEQNHEIWHSQSMAGQTDIAKIKKSVALVLDKMKNEADPVLLNEYRTVFKKEISFFRRSWAAAYLLMCFDQGETGRAKYKNVAREARSEPREPRHRPLAEEESKRLFISIGRNRRVSPREILGLINAKAGTPRDDIGAIRILDNYSFVQVREEVAEEIIEALNGQSFRGRTLVVNYAKARRDEEEAADLSGETEAAETGSDYSETAESAEADFSDDSGDSGDLEQEQYQPDEENI